MNRNILPTIFLLFINCSLFAQLNVWGNLGINYSIINTHSNKEFDITPKYGINLGIALPFSFNNYFAVEPEVCIAQKGAALVNKTYTASDFFDSYDMKFTYIEIPVSLKASITYKQMSCFIKGGFYLDCKIWEKSENIGGCTVALCNNPNFHRPFDYGFQGGIGIELFKKFSLQSRLYCGLYDILGYKNSDEYYSNVAVNFSLGYKFK